MPEESQKPPPGSRPDEMKVDPSHKHIFSSINFNVVFYILLRGNVKIVYFNDMGSSCHLLNLYVTNHSEKINEHSEMYIFCFWAYMNLY